MIEGGHGAVGGPSVRRFPALYRMPVAYLALAVVAGLWLARGGRRRGRRIGAGSVSPTVAAPLARRSSIARPERRPTCDPAGGPDAVLADGRGPAPQGRGPRAGSRPQEDARRRRHGASPLDYYARPLRPRRVADHAPGRPALGRPRRLGAPRVGRRVGHAAHGPAVAARVAAALVIYREEPCLPPRRRAGHARVTPGAARPRGRRRPAAGSDATARVAGPPVEVDPGPTACRGRSTRSPRPSPTAPRPRPAGVVEVAPAALKQIYIAFVIDTTTSMEATIDAAQGVGDGPARPAAKDQRRRDAPLRAGRVPRRRARLRLPGPTDDEVHRARSASSAFLAALRPPGSATGRSTRRCSTAWRWPSRARPAASTGPRAARASWPRS